MTLYRGACTDKKFENSACLRQCLADTENEAVCGLWPCGNDNTFACNRQDCNDTALTFGISGGNIVINQAVTTPSPVSTLSPSTATRSNIPTSAGIEKGECHSNTGTFAGLGAGLGIPLLISLAALALLYRKIQSYKRSQRTVHTVNGVTGWRAPESTEVGGDGLHELEVPLKAVRSSSHNR